MPSNLFYFTLFIFFEFSFKIPHLVSYRAWWLKEDFKPYIFCCVLFTGRAARPTLAQPYDRWLANEWNREKIIERMRKTPTTPPVPISHSRLHGVSTAGFKHNLCTAHRLCEVGHSIQRGIFAPIYSRAVLFSWRNKRKYIVMTSGFRFSKVPFEKNQKPKFILMHFLLFLHENKSTCELWRPSVFAFLKWNLLENQNPKIIPMHFVHLD